jgi:hypothetical protein
MISRDRDKPLQNKGWIANQTEHLRIYGNKHRLKKWQENGWKDNWQS